MVLEPGKETEAKKSRLMKNLRVKVIFDIRPTKSFEFLRSGFLSIFNAYYMSASSKKVLRATEM